MQCGIVCVCVCVRACACVCVRVRMCVRVYVQVTYNKISKQFFSQSAIKKKLPVSQNKQTRMRGYFSWHITFGSIGLMCFFWASCASTMIYYTVYTDENTWLAGEADATV